MSKKPVMLCIMDGFGWTPNETYGNAVAAANKPFLDSLMAKYPMTTIDASGMAVGLPDGQMGNSEVGHLNIGAGRIVFQELSRINNAIKDGSIAKNEVFVKAMDDVKADGKTLHLMGLMSPGGVHSHINHLKGLIQVAEDFGLEKTFLHAFTDGRDVDPKSGIGFIADLETFLSTKKTKLASLIGRYYAMDRDKRFDRVNLAYEAIVDHKGNSFTDPVQYVKDSYAEEVFDELKIKL